MMNTRSLGESDESVAENRSGNMQRLGARCAWTLILLAAIGAAVYEGEQAARQRRHVQSLQQAQMRLADQIQQLRQERDAALKRPEDWAASSSQRLPAPAAQSPPPPAEPARRAHPTNLFACFPGLKEKAPNRLTTGQVETYLKAHERDATSLLAAYRATGDTGLLAEAMKTHPNDPQVAFAAALQKDASPEVRRQWLETFKQADADNALPYYLSALNYLQASQVDQALPELAAALSKPQFQDYSAQRQQSDAQVYLAAGYSPAEARAIAPLAEAMDFASGDEQEVGAAFATFQSQLSPYQQVKALAVNLRDLAQSYEQSGDANSAASVLQMIISLGRHYSETAGQDGLSQLVGTAAQAIALSAMDPNSAYEGDGQTVQERLNELRQQRAAIRGLYADAAPLLADLSDQDWASYGDRARLFGEPAALQWVVGKYGQK
jgi:hypothetical protein